MRIGVARVSLHIHDARSLKQKRQVLRSLKDRLLSNFDISVAEVGSNDKWQIGELGIAIVANEGRYADAVLQKVLDHIESFPAVRMIDVETEIL